MKLDKEHKKGAGSSPAPGNGGVLLDYKSLADCVAYGYSQSVF